MRNIVCVVLLFSMLQSIAFAGSPPKPAHPAIYSEKSDGAPQIAAALKAARKTHRNVLLQFGANWCGWCHKFHALFASDKAIAATLQKNYIVVMVDVNANHNADVVARYGSPTRFGLPVLVVLGADGTQRTTEDTAKLESGDHHDPARVLAFLRQWAPKR